MELTEELKKKVENAESREQAKEEIKNAEMQLKDEELDQISGGILQIKPPKGKNYDG